ncbi:hypothetical protein GT347_27255 (plasmid) [Xylophilus rhododendri]|uniref:Uncharacterized protein n=1 Tax=Xylophilus rhododendri TaxID=2697032 RepID=A0A857JGG5_9BURK|nr:hypothetical protein [Xylophilus rhododendri]QHJ01756.1 hypothetical protein GT347_27255 [Xylophilus rhododendri]
MSKNLTTLSASALGKFLNLRNEPVVGKITPPKDFATEKAVLDNLILGNSWTGSSGVRGYDFKLDNKLHIALTMKCADDHFFSLSQDTQDGIKFENIPGSIYLFLAHQLQLMPTGGFTPDWVEEYIAGPASSEEGLKLDVIIQSLEDISVFSVDDAFLAMGNITPQYIANYISTYDPELNIGRLGDKALQSIREIFLREKKHLTQENFFNALTATKPQHAFLEIYRVLEFIFFLPRVRGLLLSLQGQGLSAQMDIMALASLCHRELGWKRIERDSIDRLFKDYSAANYNEFIDLHASCSPFTSLVIAESTDPLEKRVESVQKMGEKFYQLRNQIAHQFFPDDILACSPADWTVLIEFTLNCIKYFYERDFEIAAAGDI